MTAREDVIAADVGNSAVKLAVRSAKKSASAGGGDPSCCFKSFSLNESDWIDQLCRYLAETLPLSDRDSSQRRPQFWVSTVNRSASTPMEKGVREFLASNQWQMDWKPVQFDSIPFAIQVDYPERVGIDRLVSAYAAAAQSNRPSVVIDAGSAVTIDWVDRDADGKLAFCGGAILPGIQLQLSALASGTEAIERVSLGVSGSDDITADERFSPGKNTDDAIRVGVMAGLVGSIERLIRDYSHEAASGVPRVVLTGGDGPTVSRHLRVEHERVPDLVCQGLFRLAEH